jgi:hypothetical protein
MPFCHNERGGMPAFPLSPTYENFLLAAEHHYTGTDVPCKEIFLKKENDFWQIDKDPIFRV